MDTPFTAAQWQPSKLLEEWDTSPSDSTVEAYIQCLNAQTTNIAAHPYDPNCWLDRAMTLVKLRYPELAVGDAHKAVMLCENLLTATEERPWFKFGYRTGFLMAETDDENEGEDTHERSRQRDLYTSLQERARTLIHENLDYSPTYKRGRVILQQYPWLHERHMMRSDDLIDGINRDLAEAARTVNTNPCCVVKRYAFGHGVGARDGEDLLGIFATRDISKGENILFDKSKVWGCNGSDSTGSISQFLPPDDLDGELQWIRHSVGKFAADTILRCRLLIFAITDGVQHPLDHPLIARLAPTYCPNTYRSFDLEKDIVVMNQVLQQHGIDIFASPAWDTHVFFTLKARVSNNAWTTPHSETINSLFSFFNHSCESNVEWQTRPDLRSMTMSATRDISAGEQLFVCYDGFVADQPLEVRRERFWKWINGPCQCTKCLREEGEMRSGGDSSPADSCASSRSSSIAVGGWDTEVKPVFPEDGFVLENGLVDPHD